MPERLTHRARSLLMAKIRSRGTEPEAILGSAFSKAGLRARKQYGAEKSDFAFPGQRIAVFVDGCFWHGCRLHYRRPVNNAKYWHWKVEYNRTRDQRIRSRMKRRGWIVIRVWEHSLPKKATRVARQVLRLVRDRTPTPSEQRRRLKGAGRHSQSA